MGSVIDTEKVDLNYRCNHVKYLVIYINLICSTFSFILLLFGWIKMFFTKKKIGYTTSLTPTIFFSEIINTILKLLQLIKYFFDDHRDEKNFTEMDTPRGIICQIQIVTAIYSDFCSLLSILLLSLRCYDVLKNKRGFFGETKIRIISIILVIFISISFSIGFLFLDRFISDGNVSYRYDVRDRCSYWCWLAHFPSLICFSIYWIILILNIIFACKTNKYLKKEYKKLLSNNEDISDNRNNIKTPLNESSKENINSKDDTCEEGEDKKYNNLTKEEKKRIEELDIMRKKCLIYPWVTIFIWLFIATYRVIDDLFVEQYDRKGDNPDSSSEKEKEYFDKRPFIQFLVQFSLVLHTILSSTRGLFYGFSFIIFEEKVFYNIFRKCLKIKDDNNSEINEEEQKKEIIRSSNNSNSDFNDSKTNEDNDKQNDVDKSDTIEMNISDYGYNENN